MAEDMRNRRRAGPVNRLRRALYSVMLMSASLPALGATPEGPRKSAPGAHALPRVQLGSASQRENDLLLLRDPTLPADAALVAYEGAAALLSHARSLGPDFALVPAGNTLLTAHFLGDDLDSVSKGLGVDVLVPEMGYFHLNLYSGRDGPNLGKRWQFNPQGFALPQSADHFWSLGGSLNLERASASGRHALVFEPQLVLNLDSVVPVSGRLQAIVSYHNWRTSSGSARPDVGEVPQVFLRWSY
jgi:hypothetical protein